MNFQTMDYFVAVAEEKSFTKAAERLSVTQQTLSANIAAAEKELGSKLLERTVPLSLTFAGEEFLRYARRFQAQRRAMDQEFLDIAGNERGRLRVGVTATRGHIIMPRSIAAFQKLHPNISIEGQLDLIVATVNSSSYDLVVKKLFDEKIVLVVSQALLESLYADKVDSVVAQVKKTGKLTALEACPFLTVGKRDIAGSFARHAFAASGISPTIKVMSRNSETLLALAMRGVGACFLPSELVASSYYDSETSGLHIIELGKEMSYSVSVAWRRTDHVWSTIESFAQVLSEQRYVVKRGE